MNFNCESCNKKYSSYQSLWIHNKKYHNTKSNKKLASNDIIKCKFCNKIYKHSSSKSRHEVLCNNNPSTPSNQTEIDLLKKEVNELKQLINQKDAKNINKGQIINNSGNITNNNIKIELGLEDIKQLSQDQKLHVLKSIIFGEYPNVINSS